jgi:hypothetical protein
VISDAAHQIIASSQQDNAFVGQELARAQWRRAEPAGIFEFTDSEGRSSQEAYASSALTGWETAVWAPKALLDAPVRATWWTVGLTAVLGFSLVLGSALWLGRVIARSVSHTARAAIRFGRGWHVAVGRDPSLRGQHANGRASTGCCAATRGGARPPGEQTSASGEQRSPTARF